MKPFQQNKKKIINDPVFGFINLQSELVFDLIEHPSFQRLRRVKQLGLSYLVFPGANHTRFEHAIGATHLMRQAVSVLRAKGVKITDEEADSVTIAILLHDMGHAPFSHVLENTLVGISHERISLLLMQNLNHEFGGKLDMAIQIFTGNYQKKFLHQLVASQLDMDRLDYLTRDSFFTGVSEGVIGIDRIIKMLNVWDDRLVVDEKGIYSIEKFLIARRLMYWQVYLHKTVVAAEFMLINVLKRVRELIKNNQKLSSTRVLDVFLKNHFNYDDFEKNIQIDGKFILDWFSLLDDSDILSSLKEWQSHQDPVLSYLAGSLINRKLFSIQIYPKPISKTREEKIKRHITEKMTGNSLLSDYLIITGEILNNALNRNEEQIGILSKQGRVKDIRNASDINLGSLTRTVRKFFVCFPKELDIYNL